MIPQSVIQLSLFCKEVGLKHIVVSPGSRSAPLVLALSRMGGINLHTAMDERSGGFMALGMAISIQKPVALLCTSGTALLNYGPAIAEAFYQQVPLLILSADRPPESIDQWDGQAIRQSGVFELHTKFWANMPSMDESESAIRHARYLINKAYFEATSFPKGPVHLNFPFREPLYPSGDIQFEAFDSPVAVQNFKSPLKLDSAVFHRFSELFLSQSKRMVLIGQNPEDDELKNSLLALTDYAQVVVAGDCLNNLIEIGPQNRLLDWTHGQFLSAENAPEVLITLGMGHLSKSVRNFLKENPPRHHWHLCVAGFPPDPLGSLTDIIHCDPHWFLAHLAETAYFQFDDKKQIASQFRQSWIKQESGIEATISTILSDQPWSDFVAIHEILGQIPSHSGLFAGNSMAVRYVNALAFRLPVTTQFFANRGTSGIDGCVSTSLGIAKANQDLLLFSILGDVSFIYDRNGLWGQTIPPNLKIVVINNGGGNIFRILPGSGKVPELETLFEMDQPLSARNVAQESGMAYFSIENSKEAHSVIQSWVAHSGSAILECFTNKIINHTVFSAVKSACNGHKS